MCERRQTEAAAAAAAAAAGMEERPLRPRRWWRAALLPAMAVLWVVLYGGRRAYGPPSAISSKADSYNAAARKPYRILKESDSDQLGKVNAYNIDRSVVAGGRDNWRETEGATLPGKPLRPALPDRGTDKLGIYRKLFGSNEDVPPDWYIKKIQLLQLHGSKFLGKVAATTAAPVTRPLALPFNCSLLAQEDPSEVARVLAKRKQHPAVIPSAHEYVFRANNCSSFITSEGYVLSPLSDEEAGFPLAFSIRMHKDVAQVARLLRTIYRPQNFYCIHVDKKSSEFVLQAMAAIAKCFPNVFLASRTYNFVYQGFTPVQVDLQCMGDLLAFPWKYFLNLAGSEFPLKTNLELVRVLKVLNGTNDVEQFPFPSHFRKRIAVQYVVDKYHQLQETSVPKEPFSFANITINKGCSYNTLSRAFVEWVVHDDLAQRFIRWTSNLHSPDEIVWATLNSLPGAPGGYSPMVTQIAKTFLSREIIWHWSPSYCRDGKFVRGVCTLSLSDLGTLSRRWEFFANKFSVAYDSIVLDCLEEGMRARTKNPDPDRYINWEAIGRAPHIKLARQGLNGSQALDTPTH